MTGKRLPHPMAGAVEASLILAEVGVSSGIPFLDPADRERIRAAVLRGARRRALRVTTWGRGSSGVLRVRLDDGTPW